ncbi:MAG: hypothetical protein ACSHX5_04305 [Phycisphaerales bacterium]
MVEIVSAFVRVQGESLGIMGEMAHKNGDRFEPIPVEETVYRRHWKL